MRGRWRTIRGGFAVARRWQNHRQQRSARTAGGGITEKRGGGGKTTADKQRSDGDKGAQRRRQGGAATATKGRSFRGDAVVIEAGEAVATVAEQAVADAFPITAAQSERGAGFLVVPTVEAVVELMLVALSVDGNAEVHFLELSLAYDVFFPHFNGMFFAHFNGISLIGVAIFAHFNDNSFWCEADAAEVFSGE